MEQRIKFPRSHKVYLPGKLYPNIRVAMRKVEQVPSTYFEGEEKIIRHQWTVQRSEYEY